MKRIHDRTRLAELFVKAGLIAAIAAALLLPASINANGAERGTSPLVKQAFDAALPLPPIPHLDAIPWLVLERAPKGPQVDTLLLPASVGVSPAFATAGVRLWSAGMTGIDARTNG